MYDYSQEVRKSINIRTSSRLLSTRYSINKKGKRAKYSTRSNNFAHPVYTRSGKVEEAYGDNLHGSQTPLCLV